ncbi:uncharacterized protein [Physcomitrium patens]|uniref:Uncharacterized protein n=1 Tax=Physcomitrium patens TaxID=3218 RepID=A0A2K1L020_PHYPA|nr:uncharacterized protein LOC112275104 [Physcomitrium patens]PNR59378.1 hypothetical protein PHYPA_002169 [Physcomitrium patens]|eukprot:XP_024360902.1 uncharacterized protein LOC112275104 [Physcomitrella patens]
MRSWYSSARVVKKNTVKDRCAIRSIFEVNPEQLECGTNESSFCCLQVGVLRSFRVEHASRENRPFIKDFRRHMSAPKENVLLRAWGGEHFMEAVSAESGAVVRDRGSFHCHKLMETSLFYFSKSKPN